MKAVFLYDTTPFVKVAIWEVVKTLIEAIIPVFLIMYLFLGNLRATLIPTIAVPVVLLGTFGVLAQLFTSSTCSPCSPWCWPSGCWWTTPSSSWRTWSAS